MSKFKCKKCDSELVLAKHTMKIVDGKVVSEDAVCCDVYMDSVKEGGGFGGIIKRPNGTISGKF